MSDLPEPATMRVIWILVAAFAAAVPVLGGFVVVQWRLLVWAGERVRAIIATELQSTAIRDLLRQYAAEAMHGAVDPLARAMADLEYRQREHGRRIGSVEQDVARLQGRVQATRVEDRESST